MSLFMKKDVFFIFRYFFFVLGSELVTIVAGYHNFVDKYSHQRWPSLFEVMRVLTIEVASLLPSSTDYHWN